MKNFHLLWMGLLLTLQCLSQDIYIINSENELKILDVSSFTVSNILTVDTNAFGTMLDIAFNPDGRLFATTSFNNLIEIDLITEEVTVIAILPKGASYPGLVGNANNQLISNRFLPLELVSYDIDSGDFTIIENNISTPGDFTYFKGNLIYPSFFNDFIKAYDGTETKNVGCSVPLLFGITNVFEDCETNTVYAFDEDAKVYLYTLGEREFEVVADLWEVTGPIYGAATTTEYMASACSLVEIDVVNCDPLSMDDYNPFGIQLLENPVKDNIRLYVEQPKLEMLYTIFDIRGATIKIGELNSFEIDVSALAQGWYILKLNDSNGRTLFTEKIVKK